LFRTNGRELAGMSATGDYAAIASANPLVFITGRLTGPASIATLDGSPFVFETDGPNGTFILPVVAGQPFTIKYIDSGTGSIVGTSTGQAPSSGRLDLGLPLAPPASQLTVSADPDSQAIVDINQLLTFHFS